MTGYKKVSVSAFSNAPRRVNFWTFLAHENYFFSLPNFLPPAQSTHTSFTKCLSHTALPHIVHVAVVGFPQMEHRPVIIYSARQPKRRSRKVSISGQPSCSLRFLRFCLRMSGASASRLSFSLSYLL